MLCVEGVATGAAAIGVALIGLSSRIIGAVVAAPGDTCVPMVLTGELKVSTAFADTPMAPTGLLNKSAAAIASPAIPPASPHKIAKYNLFLFIVWPPN